MLLARVVELIAVLSPTYPVLGHEERVSTLTWMGTALPCCRHLSV